jgi:hypothetical protein
MWRWLRSRRMVLRVLLVALLLSLVAVRAGAQSEAPVIWQAPNSSLGLVLKRTAGSDGADAAETSAGGRAAMRVSSAGYLYFDVDDAYLNNQRNPSPYTYALIEVDYYDDTPGRAFFIEYSAASGCFTATDDAFLNGDQTWKTARFYLRDVRFADCQSGNTASFRINARGWRDLLVNRVSVTRSLVDLRPSFGGAGSVSFTAPSTEQGLRLRKVGEGADVATVTLGGRTGVSVSSLGQMFFDVDDTFIREGMSGGQPATEVAVEVSYYDQGYGFFYLQYDSTASLATDAIAQAFWPSFGPTFDLQSNNIVYLQNTRTWKTYTFYLSNVRFSNRQLDGVADFRIFQPQGGEYAVANQGYRLTVDRVTVTKLSQPADRTARFEGNYSGAGDPVVVWTRLAAKNEQGHGLYQLESAAATNATTVGGEAARVASSGAIAFDVNDQYIKDGNANNVFVTVEFFDAPGGALSLSYDARTSPTKSSESVARTGTNTWRRYTFYVPDAYFGNRQDGGADFRIVSTTRDLAVRNVYVQRAPGPYVRPRAAVQPPAGGFTSRQRLVMVHYFPVFDGYRPNLWERSTMGPPGADPTTHRATTYSFRNLETLRKDLTDMQAAQIDGMLVWYLGNTTDQVNMGVPAMRNLVAVAQQTSGAPKIGLLLDPVHIFHEKVMRAQNTLIDFTHPSNKGLYLKLAEDFFSQVPSDLWLTIDGRPVIALYYQGPDMISAYDKSLIETLVSGFQASFGVRPYLIADFHWDADGDKGIVVDDWFAWGAGLAPSAFPGFARPSTMEIGPGFNDGVRIRDRENGAFYERGWQRAIGKGMHRVLIDTWNYWVEGAAIAESAQYGRKYIELTAQYAAQFKQRSFANADRVSVILGPTNRSEGLYQDETEDGQTQAVTIDGVTGRQKRNVDMYFSVDDSFWYNTIGPVRVSVRYLDANAASGGADFFQIRYDGAEGPLTPREVTAEYGQFIRDSNTRTWQTRVFEIPNAVFANRQNNANDFKIEGPAGLIVAEVVVERVGGSGRPTPGPQPLLGGRIFLPIVTKSAAP